MTTIAAPEAPAVTISGTVLLPPKHLVDDDGQYLILLHIESLEDAPHGPVLVYTTALVPADAGLESADAAENVILTGRTALILAQWDGVEREELVLMVHTLTVVPKTQAA